MVSFEGTWWIGVLLAIGGNLIDATGWTLEKRSHINQQRENPKKVDSIGYLCHCQWWQGFLLHAGGSIVSAVSLGLGDQALLMPLFSITLVFNSLFAFIFLNEKLSRLQIVGTLLIVVGCAFAVAFGPKSDDVGYSAPELVAMFQNVPLLIFFALCTVAVVADYVVLRLQAVANNTFLMMSYISISGFFGSWNPLFAKCFIEILASSLNGEEMAARNAKHWFFYGSGLVVLATTLSLEYWRQEALKRFNANYVGSIYSGMVIIGGVCSGAFYFKEFRTMNALHLVVFGGSVLVSIAGIAMLTLFEDSVSEQTNGDEALSLLDSEGNATKLDEVDSPEYGSTVAIPCESAMTESEQSCVWSAAR